MNWEKTILNDQVNTLVNKAFQEDDLLRHYVENRGHWEDLVPIITKAQAKATGDIAFKEGMRKVVEWIRGFNLSVINSSHCGVAIAEDEWQAFLNENGLLEEDKDIKQ